MGEYSEPVETGEYTEPVETGEYTEPVLQPLGKLRDLTFMSGQGGNQNGQGGNQNGQGGRLQFG